MKTITIWHDSNIISEGFMEELTLVLMEMGIVLQKVEENIYFDVYELTRAEKL